MLRTIALLIILVTLETYFNFWKNNSYGRIGDSDFLYLDIVDIDLVDIGAHNWLCGYRIRTLEVLKGGLFISII